MKAISNFHLHYAAIWTIVVIAYMCGWSSLNKPLNSQLLTFLFLTVAFSTILGIARLNTEVPKDTSTFTPRSGDRRRVGLITSGFVGGFVADFAYRGGVPLLEGNYSGYDVTVDIQATVGIPVLHVALVAGSIFYALLLAERFSIAREKTYAFQFLIILALLLLNNSRGYMTFCVLGATIILVATTRGVARPKHPVMTFVIAMGVLYALLIGIGIFGNIRSGYAWNDTSYITSIGRYTEAYPTYLNENIKWTYTYLTSSLANLNYNVSNFGGGGHALNTLVDFVPETFTKEALSQQLDVRYQVSYLNASTGYVGAFYLGGGVSGLYVSYGIQILLLEVGAMVTRALGQAILLYSACASIVTIVFVFYNSYSTIATCLLLPLPICAAVLRSRASKRVGASASRLTV